MNGGLLRAWSAHCSIVVMRPKKRMPAFSIPFSRAPLTQGMSATMYRPKHTRKDVFKLGQFQNLITIATVTFQTPYGRHGAHPTKMCSHALKPLSSAQIFTGSRIHAIVRHSRPRAYRMFLKFLPQHSHIFQGAVDPKTEVGLDCVDRIP
jgi:hypothetical protein